MTKIIEMINPNIVSDLYIGDWIDKKCPKCNSQLLGNKAGQKWCSFVECDYGIEDMKDLL